MTYEKAMAEVVEFDVEDIIATSNEENDHGSWPHLATGARCLAWC